MKSQRTKIQPNHDKYLHLSHLVVCLLCKVELKVSLTPFLSRMEPQASEVEPNSVPLAFINK
uniref:Uncharacterized protein n=1 Tax=Arundo donax TaxID=35708 RepID=A0A0A9DJU7_ARUDO